MAHFQQLNFAKITAAHLTPNWAKKHILEIGAHNVNGSVKPFFNGSEYVGVDLSEGENVDIVASGHELTLPEAHFDVAISCECFEHNPEWIETFQNMYRMLKNGGVIIISCASRGRLEHGTTRTCPEVSPGTQTIGWNYYKNLNASDFKKAFPLNEMFESHVFFTNRISNDLYFVGKKSGKNATELTLNTNQPITPS